MQWIFARADCLASSTCDRWESSWPFGHLLSAIANSQTQQTIADLDFHSFATIHLVVFQLDFWIFYVSSLPFVCASHRDVLAQANRCDRSYPLQMQDHSSSPMSLYMKLSKSTRNCSTVQCIDSANLDQVCRLHHDCQVGDFSEHWITLVLTRGVPSGGWRVWVRRGKSSGRRGEC